MKLKSAIILILTLALATASTAWAADECPLVTKVRFYPRPGNAERMKGGKFTGSNQSATSDGQTIAEIKTAPAEGGWTEIAVAKPVWYRFVKYESPLRSWGNVAEIEFYSGNKKLTGSGFGTTGSRDNKGNDFTKALDGDVATFFEGVSEHNQYVGLDFGAAAQVALPTFTPAAGAYPDAQTVTIKSATPNAKIRFFKSVGNQGAPSPDRGEEYKGSVKIAKSTVFAAVAYADGLAVSPVVLAPYRIGGAARDAKVVRTFHFGNSLTDTLDGWLKPLAESAGRQMDFHRCTIPGAPTEWLWHHPGGFGSGPYNEEFFVLAPIDHLFLQPFAGHGRSVENEADYDGRFYDACRKHSPDVQLWLYVQWPGPEFKDRWAQWRGDDLKAAQREPAKTWQAGVDNHIAYTELVRQKLADKYREKPPLIVPAGKALALMKTELDAGRVPGMTDFFKEFFADGIHLTPKGRYLVSLVHYACLYKESPAGKASALTTGLTPEQLAIFQRLAWDAVKNYQWSGVKP